MVAGRGGLVGIRMMTSRSSRRLWLLLSAFLGVQPASADAPQAAHPVLVEMDRARIVRMPEGAKTLVIGNPMIADVTMLRSTRLMVVTGKSFGTTNLIMLDADGSHLSETLITVVESEDNLVVQRGMDRESYACNPQCMPTIALGDSKSYAPDVISAMREHDPARK